LRGLAAGRLRGEERERVAEKAPAPGLAGRGHALAAVVVPGGQRVARIITVRSGEAGEGRLWPTSS
jgi:hypothetical protein